MDYQGEYSTDWQLMLAFITLTILPAIVMFFARAAAHRRGPDRGRGEGLKFMSAHGRSKALIPQRTARRVVQ